MLEAGIFALARTQLANKGSLKPLDFRPPSARHCKHFLSPLSHSLCKIYFRCESKKYTFKIRTASLNFEQQHSSNPQ